MINVGYLKFYALFRIVFSIGALLEFDFLKVSTLLFMYGAFIMVVIVNLPFSVILYILFFHKCRVQLSRLAPAGIAVSKRFLHLG